GDVPWPIPVMDEQAIAERLELAQHTKQRFGRRPLQECARLCIYGHAQEIVACGIADVETYGGIERSQFDELGLPERASFFGWSRRQGFAANLRERPPGFDPDHVGTSQRNRIGQAMVWTDVCEDLPDRLGFVLLKGQYPGICVVIADISERG